MFWLFSLKMLPRALGTKGNGYKQLLKERLLYCYMNMQQGGFFIIGL